MSDICPSLRMIFPTLLGFVLASFVEPRQAAAREPTASGFLDMYNHFLLREREPLSRLKAFVLGPLDWYMGVVVVVNVVLMIWQTQRMGERAKVSLGLEGTFIEGPEVVIDDLEYAFFSVYLLDVLIRVFCLRFEWLYSSLDGVNYMNLMDAALVLISAIELFLLPAFTPPGEETDQSTRGIRILKLMRIFRALRIVKTVNLFHPLRVLLSTCIASIGALFWSMTLMLVLKLGFSLLICQAIHPFLMDSSLDIGSRLEIYALYGDFWSTMYTMLLARCSSEFWFEESAGWMLYVGQAKTNISSFTLSCFYIAAVVLLGPVLVSLLLP